MNISNSLAADVQGLAAPIETAETGTMSNVQVINNSNEVPEFKDEWEEGFYDEWIYAYNPNLKLLLIDYANSDYENIYNRLVKDKGETFSTKAEKIATNVEIDEVKDAVALITSKDWCYGMVKIDWSDKEDVDRFINS